jgi:hypothetical protein
VDAGRIDGLDGRIGVGVGRQQHPPRLGIKLACPLQKIHAGHAGHSLVAQQQRHRLLARLQLGQGVQRGLSAGRAHHPVSGSIFPPQVLHHRFQNACVVVYRQQNWPRHMSSV